ncbi:Phage protein [Fusobacterium necrophorum subsp. funduliforme]|uniref:hypothetical protein n=1 Tax=Fusobacterium necrophorum TaxID=859 RepID=UPI00254AEF0B|nr:hypothetical protein [Fusobacterium necrophorum]MDK4484775.1 hypothetical protein [Fusobacterium necrophorum]
MDKVLLLKKHMTSIVIWQKEEGQWIQGKWENEMEKEIRIQGVYLPVSADILKYYPQGAITLEDIELFTKAELKKGDMALIRGEKWQVMESTNFDYIADVKTYILKRSTKDDS